MKSTKALLRVALSTVLAFGLVPSGALAAFAATTSSEGAPESPKSLPAANAAADSGKGALELVADGAEADLTVAKSAQIAVDQPVEELLQTYFQDRSQTVMGKSDLDPEVASDQVQQVQQERADGFALMEEAANIQITGVQTTVSITSAQEQDGTLSLQAYEQVQFTYDNLADGPGGSDTARFGTSHDLTVVTDVATDPQIQADEFDEQDLCGVSVSAGQVNVGLSALNIGDEPLPEGVTPDDETPAATTPETSDEGPSHRSSDPEPAYQSTYCPADAVAYSNKYWSHYNPAYVNFNSVGGDCANFTSQAISAGGMDQKQGDVSSKDAWFYTTGSLGGGVSSSWIYCPTFVSHFRQYGKYVESPSKDQVFTGSPVLYRTGSLWNHAVLCVGKDSAGTPIINSHNTDRYHMPYTYYTGAKICTIQLTRTNTGHNLYTTKSADGKTTFTWMSTSTTAAQLHSVKTTASTVSIPATVTRAGRVHKVTNIRRNAFKGNTSVRTVTIPKYVKYVGASAFSGCSSLTTVKGAEGVTNLYSYVFYNCTKLSTIPTFGKLSSLGTGTFRNCYRLTSVPIPAKATSLSRDVFRGCVRLKSATLPSTLKTIGEGAFRSCKALTKLVVPSNVTSIGNLAFYNCPALKTIYLKTAKLTSSRVPGTSTFAKTPALTTVHCYGKAASYKKWLYKRGLSTKVKVVA